MGGSAEVAVFACLPLRRIDPSIRFMFMLFIAFIFAVSLWFYAGERLCIGGREREKDVPEEIRLLVSRWMRHTGSGTVVATSLPRGNWDVASSQSGASRVRELTRAVRPPTSC